MTRPIIKWAGGKTQLLEQLVPLIPDDYGTYYEPFLGGGALFFAVQPHHAVINDYNPSLINLYKQVKKNPEELMKELDTLTLGHSPDGDYYYERREEYNLSLKMNTKDIRQAALFIYLNKAGYNGLYRLNSDGLYNVPNGKRKNLNLYDRDNILNVSRILKHARIQCGDFEKSCKDAKAGDFVFFDSPYYNTYDAYKAGGFAQEDHVRLSRLFAELTAKGVKCLLTNSNEKYIKELYKDYDIKIVDVKRMINCDGKKRTGKEVIIKNY